MRILKYQDLRVGCVDLDKKDQSAILRISNTIDNAIISTSYFKVGGDYQIFAYKGREINIRVVKIANAGRNIFNPKAVYYEIRYKNISGTPF